MSTPVLQKNSEGTIMPINLPYESDSPVYKWGDYILFGRDGNSRPFQAMGWSDQADDRSTWTVGPEAELAFRLVAPPADVVLSFEAFPFLHPGVVEQQPLTVFFNFFRVAFFEISGMAERAIYLPREIFNLRTARLRFHIPNAISPSKLGLSQDQRRLGLAFHSVALKPSL